MHRDEAAYVHTRAGQLAARAGMTRRDLLKLGAALPLAAGVANLTGPARAQAVETAAATPIVKPLPPEWFVNFGTNAEMRWESVRNLGYTIPNERFFVRDHTATPLIDERTWRLRVFGAGLDGPGGAEFTCG